MIFHHFYETFASFHATPNWPLPHRSSPMASPIIRNLLPVLSKLVQWHEMKISFKWHSVKSFLCLEKLHFEKYLLVVVLEQDTVPACGVCYICCGLEAQVPALVVTFLMYGRALLVKWLLLGSTHTPLHLLGPDLLVLCMFFSLSFISCEKGKCWSLSRVQPFVTPWADGSPPAPWSMEFSRQEYWSHALLQGTFQTQGSNLGLLHCRQILYRLSHRESTLTYCPSAGVSAPRGQWSCFVQGCVLLGLPWWPSG